MRSEDDERGSRGQWTSCQSESAGATARKGEGRQAVGWQLKDEPWDEGMPRTRGQGRRTWAQQTRLSRASSGVWPWRPLTQVTSAIYLAATN